MTPQELKQARIDAGLTQEQMALKLGLGTSTLRKWESLEVFAERMKTNVELRYEKAKSEIEACKTLAIPEGWTYSFVIDHPHQHIFIHENYAPDVEDADSQNIVMESTFIEGLNEIKERTE